MMKHWLWYKTNGELGGELIYPCGFPDDFDPNDADSKDPQVIAFRKNFVDLPDFHGFVSYACPCGPEAVYCDCPRQRHLRSYVSGGELAPKPTYEMVLDGVVIPFSLGFGVHSKNTVATVDRTPGQVSSLYLRETADTPESIPDGVPFRIRCPNPNATMLEQDPTEVVFEKGRTPAVDVVAPPGAGLIEALGVSPVSYRYGHPQGLRIRAWRSR